MTMRKASYTNIKGHREEFSSGDLIAPDRHYGREIKIQKCKVNQFKKEGFLGDQKNIKIPIKHKMG